MKQFIQIALLGTGLCLSIPFANTYGQTIIDKIIERAKQGDIHAQATLGSEYLYGHSKYTDGSGVEKNHDLAEKWLLKAAERGSFKAQMYLGGFYYNRDFNKKRHWSKAYKWLKKTLEQVIEAEKQAVGNQKDNISRSIAKIQYKLGELRYQECDLHYISLSSCKPNDLSDNLSQSYFYAKAWFLQAAKRGNRQAQYQLAQLYEMGRGVPQSYFKAAEWYQKAIENGMNESVPLIAIAKIYLKMRNPIAAHMWFNIASTRVGNGKRAIQMRDTLANNMTPDQIAEAQLLAIKWEEKRSKNQKYIPDSNPPVGYVQWLISKVW